MMTTIVDLMVTGFQAYLMCTFNCRLFRVKQPYRKSFCIALLQNAVSYVFANFIFPEASAEKLLSGIAVFVVIGFFLFEGSKAYKVIASLIEYGIFLVLDIVLSLFFYDFIMAISYLPLAEQKLICRNILTTFAFFMCLVQEFILYRNNEKYLKLITLLGILIGSFQLIMWTALFKTNVGAMVENQTVITILFSLSLIGGYVAVTGLFKNMLKQQAKRNELEQMKLEMSYQQDYYQKVLNQAEELRNIRHDMRNQLQMIQHLLYRENEEDCKRAMLLLNEMKKKSEWEEEK